MCILDTTNALKIADAYRRFGISPTTRGVAVVKVAFPIDDAARAQSATEISSHLDANVCGTALPLTDANLASLTDWEKVRKYYKLNGLAWLAASQGEERDRKMGHLVLGAMASRGV